MEKTSYAVACVALWMCPGLDFCTSPTHSDACVEPDTNDVPCKTE